MRQCFKKQMKVANGLDKLDVNSPDFGGMLWGEMQLGLNLFVIHSKTPAISSV